MEKRIYKFSTFRLIKNIVLSIFGIFVIYMGVLLFTNKILYSAIAGLIVFALMVDSIISGVNTYVEIDKDEVIFSIKKKKKQFTISKCSFRSIIKNDDTSLYVTDEEGVEHYFDLSDIGDDDYYSLLEDLKVIGDDAPAIKLN